MPAARLDSKGAFMPPGSRRPSSRTRKPSALFLLVLSLAIGFFLYMATRDDASRVEPPLVIDYAPQAAPVMNVLTHSGATVAQAVRDLQVNPADTGVRGLVQPYLAPMSRALVAAPLGTDSTRAWKDLQSELAASKPGTPQSRPAWSDLLDEGRYRVCYDANGARLFAPGGDPGTAFRESWPLLRYPVRFLRESGRSRCATIELYAYTNAYETLSLNVRPQPFVVDPSTIDAPLAQAPLNLAALDDFLRTGTAPLAAEITDNDKFHLCGRVGEKASLAGDALTLADLAVAYRAVFWCGWNEPYISLDKNEDNRYAKVNFGGLLANTRIGQVVLDADRYFKTISTGLDPFGRKDVSGRIRASVAGFMPGDVIDLLYSHEGTAEYRYWFYPDSLRVVTDGTIGVVSSPRFLADIERQDGPRHISRAERLSIDDLNQRYDAYSRAVPTYAELDNVGRLLALMTWLRETKADERLDLASLLTVELPAWRTERVTQKLLAVSTYCGPEARLKPNDAGFLPRTRVFDFSDRLSQRTAHATDDDLLALGAECFGRLPQSTYMIEADVAQDRRLDALKSKLDREKAAIERLEREVDAAQRTVDQYSAASVDAFNSLVDRYDSARDAFNVNVEQYNRMVNASNSSDMVTQRVVSVGGGIELSLRRSQVARRLPQAREVRQLAEARPHFVDSGRVQVSGDWVRSRP